MCGKAARPARANAPSRAPSKRGQTGPASAPGRPPTAWRRPARNTPSQRPLRLAPWLQQPIRVVAPLAQTGDPQLYRPHPSVPAPFPVAVAVVDPLRARLAGTGLRTRGLPQPPSASRPPPSPSRATGPCPPSRAACAATASPPTLSSTIASSSVPTSVSALSVHPEDGGDGLPLQHPVTPPPRTTPVDSNESVHPERSRAGRLPKGKARRRMRSGPAGLPAPTRPKAPSDLTRFPHSHTLLGNAHEGG